MATRAEDCGSMGLVAWPPPMKHDPFSLSLSLSLSLSFTGLLGFNYGFWSLVCWHGGGDFAIDFGF